jgi:hypothetical protein
MSQRVKMIAIRSFQHEGRRVRANDEFETDEANAADLESAFVQAARRKPLTADAVPEPQTRPYRTRNMRPSH